MNFYAFHAAFLVSICDFYLPHVGRLTRKNTFNSINEANIKNTKYITRQAVPTFRSNLNLLHENVKYNRNSVDNNVMAEYSRPAELMPTKFCPGLIGKKTALMSHGTPKHKSISNVFEPIELQIPIEP